MEEMLIPRKALFYFFFQGKDRLDLPRCLLKTRSAGEEKEFVLTRGVVFDPIEELRAGSLY